jgi:hypothetical protein
MTTDPTLRRLAATEAERDAMRPVVDAAIAFVHDETGSQAMVDALVHAVDVMPWTDYEAERDAMRSVVDALRLARHVYYDDLGSDPGLKGLDRLTAALTTLDAYDAAQNTTAQCRDCGDSGTCSVCRGGSINEPGLSCIHCGNTHVCPSCRTDATATPTWLTGATEASNLPGFTQTMKTAFALAVNAYNHADSGGARHIVAMEAAIRAAAPIIERAALLRAAGHFAEAREVMALRDLWGDGYREAMRGAEAWLRDRAAGVGGDEA